MPASLPPPARWKLRLVRNPLVDWIHFSIWRMLFGCRLENLPDLPASGPVIFVGNHGSHFDTIFAHQFFRCMLKREGRAVTWDQMADIPGVRLLIYGFHAIPVTPKREALALRKMVRAIHAGSDLWLLSEGYRRDTLGSFHPGAAFVSLLTGCAIVPFSLRGIQPLFKNLPWPDRVWGNVSIRFHQLVDPLPYAQKFTDHRTAAEQMMADVRAAVASGIDYPDGTKC